MQPSPYQFIVTEFTAFEDDVLIRPEKIAGLQSHSKGCTLYLEGGHEVFVDQTKDEVVARIGRAHFAFLKMLEEDEARLADVPIVHPKPDGVQ